MHRLLRNKNSTTMEYPGENVHFTDDDKLGISCDC